MDFVIMDMVGNTSLERITTNNGKNALKQFRQLHCMSTGIYEIKKDKYFWCMVSRYGSYFKALPVKEI